MGLQNRTSESRNQWLHNPPEQPTKVLGGLWLHWSFVKGCFVDCCGYAVANMGKRLTAKERDQRQRAEIDAKRKALQDAADELHIAQGQPTGCGDNSCIVRPPRGMATNGGCRCELPALRAAVRWYRYEFEHGGRLEAKRRAMTAKVDV